MRGALFDSPLSRHSKAGCWEVSGTPLENLSQEITYDELSKGLSENKTTRPHCGISGRDVIYNLGSFLSSHQKSKLPSMTTQPQNGQLKAAFQLFILTIGVLYGLAHLAWRVLRWHFFNRYSGIPEIEKLGTTRSLGQKLDGTAVICGGRSVISCYIGLLSHFMDYI